MSEEERKKRFSYRLRRKRIIMLLSALLILLLVATLLTGMIAYVKDNTYYVNYSEKSAIDYGVLLKENDFYEDSSLGKDYAYIASLIDKVYAEFNYEIKMDSKEPVNFNYNYRVDAILQIKNKTSGKVLFAPVYNEIPEKSFTTTDNAVKISDLAVIDYAKYNDIAERFINTYNLDSTSAQLLLQMHVDVTGTSEEFLNNQNSNSYIASIAIPLTSQTVEVKITSAIPAEEQKILSYTTTDVSESFAFACRMLAIISAFFAIILWIYTYFSRNIDITYDIKVAKLLRNYKSFVQKMRNSFDTDGYQILIISSFEEMLDIRDTIQSPILMEENKDRTCSKFYIPTTTKLLYLYEIKVEDYDQIYNDPSGTPPAEPKSEIAEELEAELALYTVTDAELVTEQIAPQCEPERDDTEPSVDQTVEESDTVSVMAVPIEEISEPVPAELAAALENIPEDAESAALADDEAELIAYIDEAGNKIKIACNRSFTANLIQSNEQVKSFYTAIKNRILSYKNVRSRISWRYESYQRGRLSLFKMKIRGKTICLYCALDPSEFDKAKYFHEEATAKVFKDVPMLVRIRSNRGLKKALGLVDTVMQRFAIPEKKEAIEHDYAQDYPYRSTKELVEENLIKLRFPGATAAEPKAHHHVFKTVTVKHEDAVEQIVLFETDEVSADVIEELIEEVAEAPTLSLDEIDYVEESEPIDEYVETPDNPGVDVVGIVWPEKPKRNKIYRYDPDGETVEVGDVVIVPTRDASRNRDVIRKAVVAHSNHKVSPESITVPLKKIIGVLRKIQ